MAITKDSGVRGTGSIALAELSEQDQELVASRRQGITKGLSGVDVPLNAPEHDEPHVAPLWIMYGVFAALMMLTVATVAVRMIPALDFGSQINIVIALGLAFVKAALVGMFFMHLWWDSKFNQLILVSTLLFLTIFIGFAIMDTDQYQPIIEPPGAYSAPTEAALQ